MDPKCIFCRIISGESPAVTIHQDDLVIAFHDIHPAAPTHILIVPIEHVQSINQLPKENTQLIGHMFLIAKQLAAEKGIDNSGYRLIINSGPDANQTVFHLHLHLLGGRPMRYPMG
jgi:histidine triad (HIT) family protein